METETLSKYEQECPSKEDISHDQFDSTTGKHVTEDEKKLETKVTDICDSSTLLENDSDEDVEEEEKLMLSPTHSDKDYDTDEDQEILSAEENGKDEDSDEEDMINKTEGGQSSKIIEENSCDKKVCEVEADHSSDDDAENEEVDEKNNDDISGKKVISEEQETEDKLNNVQIDIDAEGKGDDNKVPEETVNTTEDTADTTQETVDTTDETADTAQDNTQETVDTTEGTANRTEETADNKEETADNTEEIADTTEEITDRIAEEVADIAGEATANNSAEVNADSAADGNADTVAELTADTVTEGVVDTAVNRNADTSKVEIPGEQTIESNDPKTTKEFNKQDEIEHIEKRKEDTRDESSDKVEIMHTNEGEDENKKVSEESGKLEDKYLSEDSAVKTKETSAKTEESSTKTEDSTSQSENSAAETEDCPLLKETLTKPKDDEKPASEEMDMDEMEDFDPSLLCPDMSMEVEENSVITDNDALPPENDDASKGVLSLCEPIFSTFVDEITGAEVSFGLSLEEISLREQTYGQKNPVQFTKIHCTACNVHLGSALDGQGNRFVHPLLKVLICKKCYHFYTSGEFEKDEDGSELYCRWCGQGGQVMCCSSCEMVFCKKCIRINFDRKKLIEIRDSDEWKCFACNPTQLIHLRIHCSSFMDYVQREMGRVSSMEDQNTFLHTDYSRCCLPAKKKATETPTGEPRRKRKKNVEQEDPDYDPFREEIAEPPLSVVNPVAANSTSGPNRLVQSTPKTDPIKVGVGQTLTNAVTRVGSVHVRPMGQIQRPKVQVINPASPSTSTGAGAGAGYTRIPPFSPRGRPPAPRGPAPRGPAPGPASHRPPLLRPARPPFTANAGGSGAPPMKHEWFEKTVRAAARVNSNLSYTLTQLNRAQANATSVEGLAVVHNKLQEILSTSINSLIQIRKNLRSEFIVGIKNIRFPSKNPPTQTPPPPKPAAATAPATVDDDVIIVSPPSTPPPPPLTPAPTNSAINLPPSVSLFKRSPAASPVVAGPSGLGRPFLRVKSFSALQSVSSECITIPDDPPPMTPTPNKDDVDDVLVVADSPRREEEEVVEKERLTNGVSAEAVEVKNLKLLNPKIIIEKSDEIDELAKSKFGLQNGEAEL